MKTTWLSGLVLIGVAVLAGGMAGCDREPAAPKPAASQAAAKHEAHHGGCLNAIETCAVGHAEVKLEGDLLKVWFVGGENETDKAVRVLDPQIDLTVKPEGGAEKTLTLAAKPNDLAAEKVGDCSYFEAQADWLAGAKKFTASGKVHLKGQERPIKIEYPEGYDPD